MYKGKFMKNALIIHSAANNSQGNWFPWLKSELQKKGYKVWLPDLPNPNEPIHNDWLHAIFSNQNWHFNDESIIIGHSAGATMALRVLEAVSEGIKIKKVILVSGVLELGTLPTTYPYKRDLIAKPFNWLKIKTSAKQFYFIHSDNDPYQCGADQGKILYKNLGGELIIKPGEGHFNLERSPQYKQFPMLLELVDQVVTRSVI
jgi:hypothetical protein